MSLVRSTILAALLGLMAVGALTVAPSPGAPLGMHEHVVLADGVCTETGWHAPGAHGTWGNHEHGAPPPQWVLDSAVPPFTQCREVAHPGYKGVDIVGTGGVELYIVAHILPTSGAHGNQFHDYQLWLHDPSGGVSIWSRNGSSNTSTLNFGGPPPPLICQDPLGKGTGASTRPAIFGLPDGREGWYTQRAANATFFELQWNITGSEDPFCASVPVTDGTSRSVVGAVNMAYAANADLVTLVPTLATYAVNQGKYTGFVFTGPVIDYAPTPMDYPN